MFAFEEKGKPVYFIYNFKRGAYYPFVPAPGEQARDSERELRIKAQLGRRAALRGGHGALVPALGDPAVGIFRSASGFRHLAGAEQVPMLPV